MSIEILNQITEDYIEEAKTVAKNAKPFAGVFGFGGGLGNDPCHERYYNKLEEALKDEDIDAYEAIKYLFNAETSYEAPKAVTFMLSAIQGLALPLIPKLSQEQKDELREWYDVHVPKRNRLPVQTNVYKALKGK